MVNETFELVELWISAILHAVLAAILLLLGGDRLDQPKYLRKVQEYINSRIDLQKDECELCMIAINPLGIKDFTSKAKKKKKVNINEIDNFDSISERISGQWVVTSDGPFKDLSFDLTNLSKSKENLIYGEALHHLLIDKPCSFPNNGVFDIEQRGQVLQKGDIIKIYLFNGNINYINMKGRGKISIVILQVGGNIKYGKQSNVRLDKDKSRSKSLQPPTPKAELTSKVFDFLNNNGPVIEDQYTP
jgi:hypothetical protein